jgi:hypothetical protein
MPSACAPDCKAASQRRTRALAECDAAIKNQLAAIARLQEQRLADQNRTNRLATMAQLALDELTDICPVCQQSHDELSTTKHLRALIAASTQLPPQIGSDEKSVEELNIRRNQLRAEQEAVRTIIRKETTVAQETTARRSIYEARLRDLGIEPNKDATANLAGRAKAIENRLERVTALLRQGEIGVKRRPAR